jgi:outer membrane protein
MRLSVVVLSFLLTAALSVSAQQALKFGHVDSDAVFSALPDLASVEKQMEVEYKKQETQLTSMQEQLKADQQKYISEAKSLTPEVRAEREQSLMQMNERVQTFYTLAQQQLQAKENELKTPLVKKVQDAIRQVGDENGFIYIFEEKAGLTVYHSTKSVDVTPLVKTKLGIN